MICCGVLNRRTQCCRNMISVQLFALHCMIALTATLACSSSSGSIASLGVLHGKFIGRIMSRNGNITWPSHLPDLSIYDLLCGGCRSIIKHTVYLTPPEALDELKEHIRAAIYMQAK